MTPRVNICLIFSKKDPDGYLPSGFVMKTGLDRTVDTVPSGHGLSLTVLYEIIKP